MALGLKRGAVRLVPYSRKWARLFEQEKKRLRAVLGSLVVDIQHIGSTAIPSIPAKPIIDISVGVRTMKDVKKLVRPFKKLGYELRPEFGGPNIQVLFVKGPERKRTHYLHVMKYNGTIWKNDLLFRDYLRKNRRVVKQYADLKKKLAKQHANDRGTYTARKSKFILATIEKARNKLKCSATETGHKGDGIRPQKGL